MISRRLAMCRSPVIVPICSSDGATKGVSRLHARFSFLAESDILVQDLGSTNGIKVAGNRIQSAHLKPGDEVLVGPIPVSVHIVGKRDPSPNWFGGSWRSRMERFERETLLETLRETQNNQSEAARLLDMPLRTLQHKRNTLGIKRKPERSPDETPE